MNICTWTDKSQDTARTSGRQNLKVPIGLLDRYCSIDLRNLAHTLGSMPSVSVPETILPLEIPFPPSWPPSFRKPRLRAGVGKNREEDRILWRASGVNPSYSILPRFFLSTQLTGLFLGPSIRNLNSKSSHCLINAGTQDQQALACRNLLG